MTDAVSDVLQGACLADLKCVRHGFFTREGGTSAGVYAGLNAGRNTDDAPAARDENLRRIAAWLGIAPEGLLQIDQVHGNNVVTVTAPWEPAARPKADGMVTRVRGLGLLIQTADCGPLLFADAKAGVIGAAHAGWRGAVGGIVEATLAAMEALGAQRDAICAAIGPCIGPQSYEVGADFPVPFIQEDRHNEAFFTASPARGKFLFDLPGYLAQKLTRLGIKSVAPSSADTFAAPDRFFSYRYACLHGEGKTGRLASVIALEK